MNSKLKKLASSPDTSEEQFLEIFEKDFETASLITINPSANIVVLRKIYEVLKEEYSVRSAASKVLCSPNIDSGFIAELCDESPDFEPEGDVDYPEDNCYPVLLAKHPNTPAEYAMQLAQSPWYMVREKVANRSDLTQEVMDLLAKDSNDNVRQILAANPCVKAITLDFLANDNNPSVRLKVALHPNASPRLIQQLSKDTNEIVRLVAQVSFSKGL